MPRWDTQLSYKKIKTIWNVSKSRKPTSTFFPDKKNWLADMLVNFVLLDKVTLEEHGTTKKLCITFLLRSGQLIYFDPSSINLKIKIQVYGLLWPTSYGSTEWLNDRMTVLPIFLVLTSLIPGHQSRLGKSVKLLLSVASSH